MYNYSAINGTLLDCSGLQPKLVTNEMEVSVIINNKAIKEEDVGQHHLGTVYPTEQWEKVIKKKII